MKPISCEAIQTCDINWALLASADARCCVSGINVSLFSYTSDGAALQPLPPSPIHIMLLLINYILLASPYFNVAWYFLQTSTMIFRWLTVIYRETARRRRRNGATGLSSFPLTSLQIQKHYAKSYENIRIITSLFSHLRAHIQCDVHSLRFSGFLLSSTEQQHD